MSISVYYKPAVAIGGKLSSATFSSNGTYYAGSFSVTGFSAVTVSVPAPSISALSVSSNGTYSVPEGIDGYGPVTVSVPEPVLISKAITSNGTYVAASESADGFSQVEVSVAANVGSVTLSENGTYQASAQGLEGFSEVTVSVPSNDTALSIISGTLSELVRSDVTYVGSRAFYYYSALKKVDLPNCVSIYTQGFTYCSNISSISLPNVTFLSTEAFAYCYSLLSIDLPKITSIKVGAFSQCSSLASANLPEVLFLANVFYGCTRLKDINAPKVLTLAGTFFGCSLSLSSANFPKCTMIGSDTFNSCKALLNASFPECLTLQPGAFASCWSLTSVYLPKCYSLAQNAFFQCSRITSIDLPNLMIMSGGGYGTGQFQTAYSLVTVNIPNFVGAIAPQAFWYGSSLTSVNCNKFITDIGYSAFAGCYRLITIPNTEFVGTIQNSAFFSCSSISSLYFPNLWSTIAQNAFAGCSSLSQILFIGCSQSNRLVSLQNVNAFSNTPISNSTYLGYYGSIYVHPDQVERYKSATNWVTYSDRIVAAPSEILSEYIFAYEFSGKTTMLEIPSEKLNAKGIGTYAFYSCYSLASVDLPNCKMIASNAFYNCQSLKTVNLPNCEFIGTSAFSSCFSIETINISNCKFMASSIFYSNKLFSVDLRNCVVMYGYNFMQCSYLTSVKLTNLLSIGNQAFSNCWRLTEVSLPKLGFLSGYNFSGCTQLSKVYLLNKNYVVGINEGAAFHNCPMTFSGYLGYFGSIYVRASLLSLYQSYWTATLKDRLVGVECYSTSASITNGTCEFDYEEVAENTSIEAKIIPDSGYYCPASVSVTGATASYNPRNGVIKISNPTAAIVVTAECGLTSPVPELNPDPILENNSWEVIKEICEAGFAPQYWSLGDTKTDVGTDGVTRTFQIVDMRGLYGKKVVFLQVELEPTDYKWNESSLVREYSNSSIRTIHLPNILLKYSSDLQSKITNTTYKVAQNVQNTATIELTDKLFLPAYTEIFDGNSNNVVEKEYNALMAFQYFWKTDVLKRIKKQNGTAKTWWTRSIQSSSSNQFIDAWSDTGNYTGPLVTSAQGVAACFAF